MRQKGFSPIIILVALGAILLGLAGAFYYLKMLGRTSNQTSTTTTSVPPGEATISDSDDSDTLENELNATQVDSADTDIQELETSASSL